MKRSTSSRYQQRAGELRGPWSRPDAWDGTIPLYRFLPAGCAYRPLTSDIGCLVNILDEISILAQQLRLDTSLVYQEIYWALGEERINRLTPTKEQFSEWKRSADGLMKFWSFAEEKLGCKLPQEDVHDIWDCIDLTLRTSQRRPFSFQDYLMIAVHSDQCCDICKRHPPDVKLDIDHILPSSRGGSNLPFNLRFLCEQHNRSRGNRFHWADVWRNAT